MKKLSIITICYNEPNLEKTCESIINQTWQDFEWIVIDGGSNKETQKIWDKYKYRIDKFISEPDNGIYNAYNKGIKLATCDWIIFMNAGDSFYNYDVLIDVFNNFDISNSEVVYGDSLFSKKDEIKTSIIKYPESISNNFFINSNINTQSTFIKKDLFLKYGNFNEYYKITADFERWIVFAKNNVNFKHIPIIIANYNCDGYSSNSKYAIQHHNEREEIINNYFTNEEIEQAKNSVKVRYSFLEQIFSIKNNPTKTCKIITFLGIHIKIKRRNK